MTTTLTSVTDAEVEAAVKTYYGLKGEVPPTSSTLFTMRRALEQFAQSRQPSSEAVELPRCDHPVAEAEIEIRLAARNYPANSMNAARAGWEAARAYLATAAIKAAHPQPAAPYRHSQIAIDFKQVTKLLTMFGGEPSVIMLSQGDGHSGKGLYAWHSDYRDEGAEYLGMADDEARPDAPVGGQGEVALQRHKFWGAGEPDCPPDIKAPNGELHTMRCKVCGDGWRKSKDVCFAATPAPSVDALVVKDAERYRFLRNGTFAQRYGPNSKEQFVLPVPDAPSNVMQGAVCQHLDVAIDAAIAAHKGTAIAAMTDKGGV